MLCFNYPAFHRKGYEDPERFTPDRWKSISLYDANFIPFGMKQNRPCPARTISWVWIKSIATTMLQVCPISPHFGFCTRERTEEHCSRIAKFSKSSKRTSFFVFVS